MPPVVAAVSAVAGFVGSLGVIGKIALQLGGSVILGAVARRQQRRAMARLRGQSINSERRFTVRAPVQPRNMIYGTVRTGGTIIYMHTSPANVLHLIIVLATHQVQNIGTIYFNGEPAIDAAGQGIGRWSGLAFAERHFGTPGSQPFVSLQTVPGSDWTPERRLTGCAAIYLALAESRDAFPTGLPDIQADVVGKNDILDPRNGTRGHTSNAALCVADYMASARFGLGIGVGDPDGIDAGDLIASANICDQWVARIGGGVEPRYSCDGIVYLDQTPKTIIEDMLTAMQGRAVFTGGRWRIFAGAYRVPTVTLTADDAVAGGITVTPRIPLRDNFNAVRGQFFAPENDWQPDDFPPIRSAVYRNEDGGVERWADIDLPFTTSPSMAQRLAKIELETQRRQMTVRFSGKLKCLRCAAGDTVLLTYPRLGIEAKQFVVTSMSTRADPDQGVVVDMILRETSPLVYDWEASEEQVYAAAPQPTLPSPFLVPAPGVPALDDFLYTTRDGVRAAIDVRWEPSPAAVSEYEVEARRVADLQGVATGEPWTTRGRTSETRTEVVDVRPGRWQVRVRAFSTLGVQSAFAENEREILGLAQPPQALTNVTLQAAGGSAIIQWDMAEELDVRIGGNILVRHSEATPPTWASSVKLNMASGASGIAVVPLKPGAYIVRARDSSGNLGPETVLPASGAQVLPFVPVADLVAAPTWAGTKAGVQVSGGALELADPATSGVYEFQSGMDFGFVRNVRLRSSIVFSAVDVTGGAWDDATGPWDSRLGTLDGGDAADIDVFVEARTSDGDPAGSPTWSEWARIDSAEMRARAVEFRAHISSESAGTNLLLSTLSVFAEEAA